jgi:YVTN family beta-propeller protein
MLPPPYRLKPLRLALSLLLSFSLLAAWLVLGVGVGVPTASAQAPPAFRNFESPQVHPLAMTPDGTRLLAVNSPNATLSVFQLTGGGPLLTAEIPVGLEPVSVAARNDREAWVVNWLSDSVSVVDLTTGNVVRTLDVGDEPTDVLFAGPGGGQAFVCVSGRSQVRVFDASNPSATPQTVNVFGKQPRALARDAGGGKVFVSVFESGNQTTVVPESVVFANGGLPAPVPAMNPSLPPAPSTALIVKWNGAQWADETGNTKWDAFVNYTLADVDLVVIDASSATPSLTTQVRGLGTHLGNMTFDASGGRLFVTNIDSTSVMRFEPNLRGRFQHTRVSALSVTPGGAASLDATNDLNPQIDFNNPAGTDAERAQGLAMPADIARSSDGTLYVAATSSARVGVLSPAGVVQGRIGVGQGPTGLAVDDARQRLYVLNRFDQTVSVVDTGSKAQVSAVPVGFNPEPAEVRNGRRFLYDTDFSAHGTVSCASCHFSGHRDGLAWDLGDPLGVVVSPNASHHPMKGPMTTQSLRGIVGTEPLHWRGDRRNLSEFNPAFTGLLGSPRLLTASEMAAFTAFVRTLTYPPNPNENLDRTFPNPPTGPNALRGSNTFRTATLTGLACNTCHQTFPGFGIGSDRVVFPGSILQEPQNFKVPQLRGIYQKAGLQKPPAGSPRAEQITGFGFLHDGTFDTLLTFLKMPVFNGFANDNARRDVEAFMLAFDTGTAPAVGLQATVNASNKGAAETQSRLGLLVQQSSPGLNQNCELVVKGIYGGVPRGFQHTGGGLFQPDSLSEATVTLQQLVDAAGEGAELTFTGVPLGAGRRMGIDRDGDNLLDDDEPRTSVSVSGRVVDAAGNGVAGVGVLLSGTQNASAQTDAAGRYVFNFVSTAGTHTVTPQGAGVTFTPQSRTFDNPSWNASASFVTSAAHASDASTFFVTQHYNDFLSREPDAAGLAHWTNEIEQCGPDADCRGLKRQNVSAAFFLSIEFKETGYLVYRSYKASFGDLQNKPVPVTFRQLMTDTQRIGRNIIVGQGDWAARLEANKTAFFRGWVQRPEFLAQFPASMSPGDFAAALNRNAGFVLTQAEFDQLVAALAANNNTAGRAAAVRRVAENSELERRELNKAFVLMEYFGYMRRDPDSPPDEDFRGWQFWLKKLDDAQGNFINAQMVESFITSIEYRARFGPQ